MASLTYFLKPRYRGYILLILVAVAVILIACKPEEITPKETKTLECRPRECGCSYVCGYSNPENCSPCEGEKSIAQVCIVSDGECKNAQPEMVSCALSKGSWTTCGSGCGPVLIGQDLLEQRTCPQVCIQQCKCPSEAPYWNGECVDDSKKGPVILVQKRSEAGSMKFNFRALLYNFAYVREKVYCAKYEWDFGDGKIETMNPVCSEYNEKSEVQDSFQTAHTFSERGNHTVTLTISKADFAVSTNVDVVV